MLKSNLLVKISGDGLKSKIVKEYLRESVKKYSITVITGGGSDINKIFKEKGYEIEFCPLGRITKSLEERQEAKKILEKNQAMLQDEYDSEGICVRVEIPFREIGTVSCPENGDVMVLSAYLGFDKIVIFTKQENVEAKRQWLKKVAEAFCHIEKGELDKIEVRGF